MKMQIWKFGPLYPGHDWRDIPLDEFAKVLHFGEQNGRLFFWAQVNPTSDRRILRDFMVIPTGADVPDDGIYHKSVITSDGTVWHLYEKV